MVNRCDSIDALRYAYYEMMRIKEENQMLEKNKDYVEFSLQYTSVDWERRSKDWPEVCLKGYSDFSFPGVPIMDVVCNEFDHKVVVVSKRDFEKLQKDNQHYREMAKQWEENYNLLLKKTGFDTVESLVFYLTNIGKCDTLLGALASLRDRAKYTCDEWKDMKKKLEECEKDYISEKDKVEELEKEIGIYSRTLKDWKEGTGCPSPSAAKTLIESGMSYEYAYHEGQKENRKLTEEVNSWKNVTGYSIPESYLAARTNSIATEQLCCGRDLRHTLQVDLEYYRAMSSTQGKSIYCWKEATGCNTPEQAKERIKALNERIDESEACYNHLLNLTGFESDGEIEDALDKCDHSTLRKALVDYEFDYEALLKLTGYKTEQDIRVLLNDSEQFVYKDMRELINSLKRKAKFTESNWQKATGFSAPEKCSSYIDRLEKKLEDIKNLTEED